MCWFILKINMTLLLFRFVDLFIYSFKLMFIYQQTTSSSSSSVTANTAGSTSQNTASSAASKYKMLKCTDCNVFLSSETQYRVVSIIYRDLSNTNILHICCRKLRLVGGPKVEQLDVVYQYSFNSVHWRHRVVSTLNYRTSGAFVLACLSTQSKLNFGWRE